MRVAVRATCRVCGADQLDQGPAAQQWMTAAVPGAGGDGVDVLGGSHLGRQAPLEVVDEYAIGRAMGVAHRVVAADPGVAGTAAAAVGQVRAVAAALFGSGGDRGGEQVGQGGGSARCPRRQSGWPQKRWQG